VKILKWILLLLLLNILVIGIVQANENSSLNESITWTDLGIGINNPGEIKDWTYYGIKTPNEASLWINALKPLRGVSYAGVARLWRQNGFTANETKEWIQCGIKRVEEVNHWQNAGIKKARDLKKWNEIGIVKPWQYESWKKYVNSPDEAKKWIDSGFSLEDVGIEVLKGHLSPNEVYIAREKEEKQESRKEKIESNLYTAGTTVNGTDTMQDREVNGNIPVELASDYRSLSGEGDGYQLFLLFYFIIMIITIFKGYGENRTVIIFRDYNDLGLTFLIPTAFILIFYLFMMFGGNPSWGAGLAFIVSMSLFVILIKNTYEDNNKVILPTILSIMTKVPLGIIWIFSFITLLNPSGKTAAQRRKNRGTALVIGVLITPIIGMLVVEKEGSLFNPRDWIKGKRIGSIRKHL